MPEGDLPIENPDRLRWANPETVQDAFRLALDLRFDSRMNDCCFHDLTVSHSQHIGQVILWGQRRQCGRELPLIAWLAPVLFPCIEKLLSESQLNVIPEF